LNRGICIASIGEWDCRNSLESDDFILFPVLHDYAEVEINSAFQAEKNQKGYLPVPILSD